MSYEMDCSGQRYAVGIRCRMRWIALGRVCSGYYISCEMDCIKAGFAVVTTCRVR